MKKLLYAFSITLFLISCNKETSTTFYEVNTSSTIGGEIDVNGGIFEENSIVTLTATPSNKNYQNYIFTGWSGTISSTENPLSIIISENMSITANFRLEKIWEDEVYATIKPFDTKSYVEAFILDAKRYGLDLSRVDLENMDFEIREMEGFAYSRSSCYLDKVAITIQKNLWDYHNKKLFESEDIFIWMLGIVYHELGHDILGLAHLCAGGHIMTGNHQDPQGECTDRKENIYELKYNRKDSILNWQRSVKDMFTYNKQYFLYCNQQSSKGNNIIYN